MGGVAVGCVLVITDESAHRDLIFRRGEITSKGATAQMNAFDRIRAIQKEMVSLTQKGREGEGWLVIEQKLEPDPIDKMVDLLNSKSKDANPKLIQEQKTLL